MTILCGHYQPATNYTETIIISLVSSGLFALIIFLLGLLYDRLKYSQHAATYHRLYNRDKVELQGQIAATAKVEYKSKGELIINVTTLIHEHHENHSDDYIFQEPSIQEWKGIITMESEEAGKLYFYYLRPEEQKNEKRSHFKRVLFLHNCKHLKLFGEGGYGEELFDRV